MSHWVTERCGLVPAPGGLALVQDLLNTRKIGSKGVDLLDTIEAAESWLPDIVDAWVAESGSTIDTPRGPAQLSERDLADLRTVRDDVGRLLTGGAPPAESRELGMVALQLSPSGQVSLEPAGAGWQQLTAAIWIEVYSAQQNGTWQRLKVCRNPVCGSTFFDRSKNNSGVWHDVKVCGNAANLRASRARKRLAATGSNTQHPHG